MPIKESELILNPDGSVYHLNLKPENIANTVIFVGDQDRVEKITKYFDTIEFKTQKREFVSIGRWKNFEGRFESCQNGTRNVKFRNGLRCRCGAQLLGFCRYARGSRAPQAAWAER